MRKNETVVEDRDKDEAVAVLYILVVYISLFRPCIPSNVVGCAML